MNKAFQAEVGLAPEDTQFVRIGQIVRSLHDALREIGVNDAVAEAASEFPSARARLLHIAQLTENSANTVLTKVEQAGPVQEGLASRADCLMANWQAAYGDPSFPQAQADMAVRTMDFIADVSAGCNSTRGALSDIMMAQDFQDLTGQLIKKVVSLIEGTERDLLNLLIEAAPPGAISPVKKEEIMAGPGTRNAGALDQANVDDLLADLGF
jgi:chemotaxis protein CheZ